MKQIVCKPARSDGWCLAKVLLRSGLAGILFVKSIERRETNAFSAAGEAVLMNFSVFAQIDAELMKLGQLIRLLYQNRWYNLLV